MTQEEREALVRPSCGVYPSWSQPPRRRQEVRLRVALEAVEDRAVAVLTRFDGDQVGWRSYECGLCGGSWDEGADREHTESCPLSALAHPPSEAAQRPEETE